MTNQTPHTIEGEKLLETFLDKLNRNVFVKSTNSVTDEVEELNPIIEDQEAVIVISGEWDREDLKAILSHIAETAREEVVTFIKTEVRESAESLSKNPKSLKEILDEALAPTYKGKDEEK